MHSNELPPIYKETGWLALTIRLCAVRAGWPNYVHERNKGHRAVHRGCVVRLPEHDGRHAAEISSRARGDRLPFVRTDVTLSK